MRFLRGMAPAILGALALAAPQAAQAATTVGPVGAPINCVQTARTLIGTTEPSVIPAPGVLTSFSSKKVGNATLAGLPIAWLVTRPSTSTIIASVPGIIGSASPFDAAAPARVPVLAGDELGLTGFPSTPWGCAVTGFVGASLTSFTTGGVPGPLPSGGIVQPTAAPNVVATLEADADADGYGDETQDTCPADAAIHTGACASDLGVSTKVLTGGVVQTGTAAVLVTVTNYGLDAEPDVRLAGTAPAGTTVTDIATSQGSCAVAPALECTLGTIPAGGRALVAVLLRGDAPGPKSVGFRVTHPRPDGAPANDTASAAVMVQAPPVQAAATPFAFCRVPNVRGMSVRVARVVLAGGGCRLGRKRTRVRVGIRQTGRLLIARQAQKPGKKLPLDARVNVTLAFGVKPA